MNALDRRHRTLDTVESADQDAVHTMHRFSDHRTSTTHTHTQMHKQKFYRQFPGLIWLAGDFPKVSKEALKD